MLYKILKARVYDVAVETPLEIAPRLSGRLGCNVLLKREDLQPGFSFKIRGAYNMLAQFALADIEAGVLCVSAGHLMALGYPHVDETNNPAYREFLA